jgi:mRNA-degrading endonuclease HigB of HigAB toxin-antitoxin module
MNVISKPHLFAGARATGNPELTEKVSRWCEVAVKNNLESFPEVRRVFASADWVADRIVFNPGSYRLIRGVSFRRKALFFEALLSHAADEKGGWKS